MQLYQDLDNHHIKQVSKIPFQCNVRGVRIVSGQTAAVKLYSIFGCCLLAVLFISSCKKDKSSSEEELYGTWVNRNAPGDTLIFFKKNNKHILSINNSFNPTLPARKETEYTFRDQKLIVNTSIVSSAPVQQITSFIWIEKGKIFEIKGFQLYLFMSSTLTSFVYVKQPM